ncbi:hypothetical protein M426DRAFT_320818 [Hypoxylon sp. CI-4A]|nr:hypothetical protein M426DRAFT_320818 [Hypoxylon sp. CI-4A]
MADATGSDKTLLERLNALKPSTVTLDPSTKSVAASTIEPAKPPSREDALTERLKSLRSQSDNKAHETSNSEANHTDGDTVAPLSLGHASQPQSWLKSPDRDLDTWKVSSTEEIDDADPLYTDDQTLEELLADLESDQPWLDEVAAEEEEHRRVMSLLDELGKSSVPVEDSEETSKPIQDKDEKGDEESDDDNSDSEQMARETDGILAQAVDEAELEKASRPRPLSHSEPPPSPPPTSSYHDAEPKTQEKHEDQPHTPEQNPSPESDPFNLPAVPKDLQDQPVSQEDDASFAASITSRMAALNVNNNSPPKSLTLPSVPDAAVDQFGLPSAPSFAPADRPAPGLIKRFGFTDEDQKTWCIVCLEDGAIRCLDCDGDVYCARCWREMHVGPQAGYDERGHRWETFVRGR